MGEGKFKKHIGAGAPVVINDDEFVLKPAGIDKTAKHLFTLTRKLSKSDSEGMSLESMDDEFAGAVAGLITETLTVSYPDEPEQELKQFGMKYMFALMKPVLELYSVSSNESKKYAKIEALRRKRAKANDTKQDT